MQTEKCESSDSRVGTALTFLQIGLGIGATVGVLLAPKPGRQLRKELRRSYADVRETASDWSDEVKDRFEEVVKKTGDFAEEVRSMAGPLSDLLRRS